MFMKLTTQKGGRMLRFLRLDYFGKKNFEPAKKVEPVLINETRAFHIGYFTGKQKEGSKVYISLKDLENLTKLITGASTHYSRQEPDLDSVGESVV
jgi:hypothetical protein